MDRAIIIFICLISFLAFSQRDEYLNFVKNEVIQTPQETLIELKNKPASSLYSPANRLSDVDNREKHLQLSINLFRKKKYSLLLKSMQSFEKKYGENKSEGLHKFFQIVILEEKLKKKANEQILSLVKKAIKNFKGSDLNLKFAFYKVQLKYNLLDRDWRLLDDNAKEYIAEAKKIGLGLEVSWATKLRVETYLSNSKMVDKSILGQIPEVYKADYIVYELVSKDQYQEIEKLYFEQTWHNATQSLLNNLIFTALKLQNDEFARVYNSRLSMLLRAESENTKFFNMIINDEDNLSFNNKKLQVISRLISLNHNPYVVLTSEQRLLLNTELKVYLWKMRLEHLALKKQKESYWSYISAIPFFQLKKHEINTVIDSHKSFLNKLYQDKFTDRKFQDITSHWEKMSIKSNLHEHIAQDIIYIVGESYLKLKNTHKYDAIVDIAKLETLKRLEASRLFNEKKWKQFLRYSEAIRDQRTLAMRALAYLELGITDKSEKLFSQVLASDEKLRGEIKEDFFMGYIRLITSSNNSPEHKYQRLNRINSGINYQGVSSNRVKEAIEAHLIGLKMTLKTESFEKILTSVNFFLKNYPRSQFYSMMILTRAKILAQLKKIAESMEALKELIKETDDVEIKTQALDELSVLKNN